MTELELYMAFVQVASYSDAHIQNFTALLFAFLIAAYLVSHKLDRVMVGIVLSLYSAMALRYTFVYFNASDDVVAMAAQLRKLAAMPDSNIAWLEIGPVHIFYTAVAGIMFLCYLASIAFFFRTRHSERSGSGESASIGGL